MLVRLASTTGPKSVYNIGLDNITEADGLAVGEVSELVHELVHELVSGVYTVADDDLFRVLARLRQLNGTEIEPSASASFLGLKLMESVLQANPTATHIFWTTGGSFVPAEEYEKFYQRGCELLSR
jgi:D-serine dehydratase